MREKGVGIGGEAKRIAVFCLDDERVRQAAGLSMIRAFSRTMLLLLMLSVSLRLVGRFFFLFLTTDLPSLLRLPTSCPVVSETSRHRGGAAYPECRTSASSVSVGGSRVKGVGALKL